MKGFSSVLWVVIAILAVFVVGSSLLAARDREPYTSSFKDTSNFECGQSLAFFGGGLGVLLFILWVLNPRDMEDSASKLTGGKRR